MITIQQLRFFNAVMKFGSLSRAATAVNRTQPAISAGIKTLEDTLDLTLFERSGGKLVPTAEAYFLKERSEDLISRLDLTQELLTTVRKGTVGDLRVACLPSAAQFLMPEILASYVAERPDVTISFMTRTSPTIHELVASQQYDLGLAEPRRDIAGESYFIEEYELPGYLAINATSALAEKSDINAADLDGVPFVGLYGDHYTTAQIRDMVETKGGRFFQQVELQTAISSLLFVERNIGYSFIDSLTMSSYDLIASSRKNIVFRPFTLSHGVRVAILIPKFRHQSVLANSLKTVMREAIISMGGTTVPDP
ncbi:LysR family transcriptional regulator [Alphaproteobacteria bacterium LSUCC0719]